MLFRLYCWLLSLEDRLCVFVHQTLAAELPSYGTDFVIDRITVSLLLEQWEVHCFESVTVFAHPQKKQVALLEARKER
mgnify:CR=1 FL=1